MDPWRDKPIEKRPKDERKFSFKNPVDRTIVLVIAGVVLVLVIIVVVLLILFL